MKDIEINVQSILKDVKTNGDVALIKYSKEFDNIMLTDDNLFLDKEALVITIFLSNCKLLFLLFILDK